LEGLRRLHEAGVCSSVITNQACISRGMTTAATMDALHERMLAEVRKHGGRIERVYVCPHRRDEGCDCKKPRPGNLLRAAQDLGVLPAFCCFVGDRYMDVQAAHNAGMTAFMVRSGYESDWPSALVRDPAPMGVFNDLAEFVDWLLGDGAPAGPR
jgi:D-glycero-D-manno-heptose 1,7-bisphosphate phosphatase